MRPRRLELEGFTSFRERTCLDLTDLDLFAITGPTGAGKSSLLDAITYALYGRVPRLPANQIRPCIAQGFTRMWVELEFEVGPERYRVHRESRRNGQAPPRLERWDGQGWLPQAVSRQRGDLNQKIQQIVGIDFDGFVRSALLPQGQFQEFLAGDPDKRREVVGRLLHLEVYEAVREKAAQRARERSASMQAKQELVTSALADATAERLEAMGQELEELEREQAELSAEVDQLRAARDLAQTAARDQRELEAARRDLAEASTRQRAIEAQATEAEATVAALQTDLATVQDRLARNAFDPQRLAQLSLDLRRAAELESDQEQAQALTARVEDLENRAAALETARREVEDRLDRNAFDPDRLGLLNRSLFLAAELERAHLQAAAAEKETESARQQVDEAARAAEKAQAEADAAKAELEAAEAALQAAQQANAAAVVQQTLEPGQACPVCGATVGELPHIECPDLQTAQQARDQAARGERHAADVAQRAAAGRQVALAAQAEAERRAAEAQAQAERLQAELAQAFPGPLPSQADIQHQLDEQQRAKAERDQLAREREQVQTDLAATQEQLAAARAQLSQLEDRVARLQAELAQAFPGPLPSQADIQHQLDEQQRAKAERDQLEREREQVQTDLAAAQEQLAAARAQALQLQAQVTHLEAQIHQRSTLLAALLTELQRRAKGSAWGAVLSGLDAGPALGAAADQALAGIDRALQDAVDRQRERQIRVGELRQRVQDTEARIAERGQLEQEIAALKRQYDVAHDLAEMMQANRFQAFVQAESLRRLAEAGSPRLLELSSQRYRLRIADNGQDFEVVDQWNADDARSVKTLSGGETFLASLALALAMPEVLPELAASGRMALDSIFIDEGFGALDPVSLDLVAEALDSLRAHHRLVCVVTHLKELAERLPARIEVVKSEAGSRVNGAEC